MPATTTPPPPAPQRDPADREKPADPSAVTWRSGQVARAALIVIGIWLGLLLLWSANVLVFVVFLGVLFGVAVAAGVDRLEHIGIRRGILSAALVFGTVGIIGLCFALLFPTLSAQARELRRDLPEAVGKVQEFVNNPQFGFLDPFLRSPEDSTAVDSTDVTDSLSDSVRSDSVRRAGASARERVLPPPPMPDSAALAAMEQISRAIDDSLRARSPRARAPDSGLFRPAAPLRDLRDSLAADSERIVPTGVLGDTALSTPELDLDAQLEARTTFLRDSLRRAMQRNVAEAEQRAREEILSSGIVAGPREPTRSEMLARRLSSGLAGSSRQLFSIVTGTIAALGGLIMIMFLAIFIGAEPKVYRNWMLAPVPAEHRAHVRVVFAEMATVLRKWLVTQLVAMVVIGVVSTIALLVLDVRAAFALGFIAGLLEFVPTVGPILAAVPAVAMGFVDSPQKALLVLVVYWAIQFIENNLLIPALMRGEIDLPPAITLVAQALMAVLFGFIGLMVAVPLTAAVLVPIRMAAARQDAREFALLREQVEDELEEGVAGGAVNDADIEQIAGEVAAAEVQRRSEGVQT